MSLDYTCYTVRRQRVSCEDVRRHLGTWQIRVTIPDTRRQVAPKARLPQFSYVWGWRLKLVSREIEGAILDNDDRVLVRLVKRNLLGCCELEIQDFVPESDHMETVSSKRYREFLLGVKCRYDTRTSAGGNELSWELQKAVCRAIARDAGGLLEEPQLGQFRLVAAAKSA